MILPVPNLSFLTRLASSVLATVAGGTLALAALAMLRRWHHDRFDRRVKALCAYFGLTPAALLQAKYSPQCLAKLRALPISTLEFLVEPLLLKCASAPPLAGVLQEICLELGLIDVWQRRILGQFAPVSLRQACSIPDGPLHFFSRLHFLLRARSARSLGLLRHRASWPILAKALDDPHPDVQRVALRALAVLREPQSLPVLVMQMDKAVTDHRCGLSLHSLKAALANFPLAQALRLLPALRHPNPRVRAAAAEILLEMAKRERPDAPALIQYKSVLDREMTTLTSDVDPRVRAIAFEVAAALDSGISAPDGRQDRDKAKDAVRDGPSEASPQRPEGPPLAELLRLLADPQRSVRQAALPAILAHGREGLSKVYEQFLKTEDKTLRNQILEELDRAGLLPNLLQKLDGDSRSLETRVVELIVSMGATRYLQAALTNIYGHQLLQVLFEKLENHSSQKVDAWLGICAALKASRRPDPTDPGPAPVAA
jgi:HEAT repeat protein